MQNNIIQYITELNKKAENLNRQRQQALGAVQAAENTFKNMAQQYKELYGTEITPENLEAEYKKARAEAEEKAHILEKQIQYIESGNYKSEV